MESYNFRIVNLHGLKGRSYVSFYMNGKRFREYNGNNLQLKIYPNRSKSIKEKVRLLKRLMLELMKAIEEENYPVISDQPICRAKLISNKKTITYPTQILLDNAIQ
jgi:hypothetical protein